MRKFLVASILAAATLAATMLTVGAATTWPSCC
jgi:hypothetical protein